VVLLLLQILYVLVEPADVDVWVELLHFVDVLLVHVAGDDACLFVDRVEITAAGQDVDAIHDVVGDLRFVQQLAVDKAFLLLVLGYLLLATGLEAFVLVLLFHGGPQDLAHVVDDVLFFLVAAIVGVVLAVGEWVFDDLDVGILWGDFLVSQQADELVVLILVHDERALLLVHVVVLAEHLAHGAFVELALRLGHVLHHRVFRNIFFVFLLEFQLVLALLVVALLLL